jgi:DNA-binding NarL/FixJ family response regulator
MVAGLNNSEIAEKLVVSPSTIKSHVSNILTKFGVTSRTEAAGAGRAPRTALFCYPATSG